MWDPARLFFLACLASAAHSVVLDEANESTIIPTIHYVPINQSYDSYNLPVVAKCCKANETLIKTDANSDATCNSINPLEFAPFHPYFHDYNESGIMVPDAEEVNNTRPEFVALVGDPCIKRYVLEPAALPNEDTYYLLLNGSIYAPRPTPIMLKPGIDYCMEVLPEMGLSVLVCFEVEEASALITYYACGLLISVPFLLLTIVAYAITPRLMDVHGKALCHYCGCLALAFTTLALVQLGSAYASNELCISVAFVIQFLFVASFFWLNVMCIETYLLVRRHVERGSSTPRINPGRLFFYYSLWAWVPPVLLIFISVVMHLSPTIPMNYIKPSFGENSCWFKSSKEAMPYFYVPVSLLVFMNLVLFALTAVSIARYQRDLDLRQLARNQESDREEQRLFRRLKRVFFVCLGLFFLMGVNWAMELISWWAGGDALAWSAFDLVNALQGLIVFGLFVLRKPVRNIVWCRIQKLRGIQVEEPELGSMALYLLPVINGGDAMPRERIS